MKQEEGNKKSRKIREINQIRMKKKIGRRKNEENRKI